MPGVIFPIAVLLFGAYAVLDGVWTMSSMLWTARPAIGSLAMIAEGLVSLALGMVALAWPKVPRDVIYVIAGYAIVFGAVIMLAAGSFRREYLMRPTVQAHRRAA